jgi:CO/xanthine dehydrogenase FAD-binding subunit
MGYPDYTAPTALEAALEQLGNRSIITRVLAGGTDLIPRLHFGEIKPDLLVDIRHLPIKSIRSEGDHLQLGAGLTCNQLIAHGLVTNDFPALVNACQEIASPALRNRITLGGNLAAAFPQANTIPALMVYDAQIVVANQKTERRIALEHLYQPSGESMLEPGDLIKSILIPFPPPATSSRFIKFGFRRGLATAIVNVAVRLTLDKVGVIQEARIALGAYSEMPLRASNYENRLVGCKLSEAPLDQFPDLMIDTVPARADLFAGADYRKKISRVLVIRALQQVYSDLRGQEAHA